MEGRREGGRRGEGERGQWRGVLISPPEHPLQRRWRMMEAEGGGVHFKTWLHREPRVENIQGQVLRLNFESPEKFLLHARPTTQRKIAHPITALFPLPAFFVNIYGLFVCFSWQSTNFIEQSGPLAATAAFKNSLHTRARTHSRWLFSGCTVTSAETSLWT